MIGRRGLLISGASLAGGPALATALPVPASHRLDFRMMRHGTDIGQHALVFAPQGDRLEVRVKVRAVVTLFSITLLNYALDVVETWQDGVLMAVSGSTHKNSRTGWVQATRGPTGLVVTGSQTARYVAPEGALTTSYWNRRALNGPMISLEDGVLLHPRVVQESMEAIPLASGALIQANHFSLSGDFAVDLWYDSGQTWASLAYTALDGSVTQYQRL